MQISIFVACQVYRCRIRVRFVMSWTRVQWLFPSLNFARYLKPGSLIMWRQSACSEEDWRTDGRTDCAVFQSLDRQAAARVSQQQVVHAPLLLCAVPGKERRAVLTSSRAALTLVQVQTFWGKTRIVTTELNTTICFISAFKWDIP